MSALGAYMIYGIEGFYDTANTTCKKNFQACQNACGSSNQACWSGCSKAYTTCLSQAVNAESVVVTGGLQGGYMDSILKYVAQNNPEMLGERETGDMSWKTANGSRTSIPRYSTDLTALYDTSYNNGSLIATASPSVASATKSAYVATATATATPSVSATKSASVSPSVTPSVSPSVSATPSPSTSTSTSSTAWDKNRDTYSSGWPSQNYNSLQTDGAYDSNIGLEGSYNVQIKKWKPHEIPTPEVVRTVSAPTDEGTVASQIRHDSYPTPSLQQLIREDAKDTVDGIFRNQYEIKYS